MKQFLRGEGSTADQQSDWDVSQPVRRCVANYAKMNVLEYMYYSVVHWGIATDTYYILKNSFVSLLVAITANVTNVLWLVLIPLTAPIKSYITIRQARIELPKLQAIEEQLKKNEKKILKELRKQAKKEKKNG